MESREARQKSREETYMDELDRLVDTWNIPYDEAIIILGEPPYKTYETVDQPIAEEMHSETKQGRFARGVLRIVRQHYNGRQYGEDANIDYRDNKPSYYRRFKPLTPEQLATNRRGVRLVRYALDAQKTT